MDNVLTRMVSVENLFEISLTNYLPRRGCGLSVTAVGAAS